MNLKLIGGKFGSRLLKSPKGLKTRPTSALLRKAVFDICREYIPNAHFLDLFAGTGAMGIEALSRGAAYCTFVEKDRHAFRCIQENIKLLGLESNSKVFNSDALLMLKKFVHSQEDFDIIYLDPPYRATFLPLVLETIDRNSLLSPRGLVFIEEAFPSQFHFSNLHLIYLKLVDTRKFGKSLLHKFEKMLTN
jgi:16S rRNA (guanine(966)-N(2))-methyltransferase RsmD